MTIDVTLKSERYISFFVLHYVLCNLTFNPLNSSTFTIKTSLYLSFKSTYLLAKRSCKHVS